MRPLTLAELVGATGAVAGPQTDAGSIDVGSISSVVVDSRLVGPGALFVATPGERVDGHDFAEAAVRAGARLVLATRPLVAADGSPLPCLVVDDTVVALGRLAAWYRTHVLTATVVAITGSTGKTSTKDLVTAVLGGIGPTVGPPGSLNTEVGLPLTILSADPQTAFLVLEMGMRGEGHIAYLAEIARPDIGVVINVGSAHLGMLGSQEAIARAKGELVRALPPQAVAVLNGDDPLVRSMAATTSARVVLYGETGGDVRATGVGLDDQAHATFTLVDAATGASAPVRLRLRGDHFVGNALAAAAVGLAVGADVARVAGLLSTAEPASRWRMEVREAPGGYTVVNDAYNANPDSMRAALRALVAMAGERRSWAVLGEMRELGEDTMAEHDAIGRLAVRLDVSRLVCVGEGARVMHLGAATEGSWSNETVHVPDADAAIALVRAEIRPGDVVLVKASRSIGLERVALALLDEAGDR